MSKRIVNIEEIVKTGLEQVMRGYLLQLHNITDGAVWNEIESNEDKGYEVRAIIEKAESDIRDLGISRGIFAPEVQGSKGFEAYFLWKLLNGEDTDSILDKQKLHINQDSLKSLITQLEGLVEE